MKLFINVHDMMKNLGNLEFEKKILNYKKLILRHPFLTKNFNLDFRKNLFNDFSILYKKYFFGNQGFIKWEDIKQINDNDLISYYDICKKYVNIGKKNKNKFVSINLNGGLGTGMGCGEPKSLLKVDFKETILQKIISQSENNNFNLLLMNSFFTDYKVKKFLKKLKFKLNNFKFPMIFNQGLFPRIDAVFKDPLCVNNDPWLDCNFAPPGHLDIFRSLYFSNTLDLLLKKSINYALISNVDNLSATLDYGILGFMIKEDKDFIMEVTPKTLADTKGGALVRLKGKNEDKLFVLEKAQCPKKYIKIFENISYFKYFNTNNIWINLKALKRKLQFWKTSGFTNNVPLIVSNKVVNGYNAVQLEQAMGGVISIFDNVSAVNIPLEIREKRFMPIKQTRDYLRVLSDYSFIDKNGFISKNSENEIGREPVKIVLDDRYYKNVKQFLNRFKTNISLKNADSLVIKGDIRFEGDTSFIGSVSIENKDNKQYIFKNQKFENIRCIVKNGKANFY
jgi:UTP--glucose-1-phosphate uridylyltransferase